MTVATHTSPTRVRGQAMAEFVVMVAGGVLLLFVLVPVVAKLADMAYTAQQVARYVAWERTVWFDTNKTPGETDDGDTAQRGNEAVLKSAEKRLMSYSAAIQPFTAADIDGNANTSSNHTLWRWTHGGGAKPMTASGSMPSTSSLSAEDTPSYSYDVIGIYNDAMGGVMNVLSFLKIAKDDDFLQVAHETENFYNPNIVIPVAMAGSRLGSQPLFGGALDKQLNIRAQSAVLADGWNAQGDAHFKERADDFAVGTMLSNPLIETIISTIGIFEPSFKDVEFDYVGIEPIPDKPAKCTSSTGFCYFE